MSSVDQDCCETTDEAAEQILRQLVDDGHLEPAGNDDDGEPMYRITDAGRAYARQLMRDRGLLDGGGS